MKNLLVFSAATLLCLQTALWDWVITQKTQAEGKEVITTLKAKGDKSRMDMGDQMSVLMDASTGETTMFMHEQKMMMKVNGDSLKGLMAMAGAALGGEKAAKPAPTGQMEKVGEHQCEIFTWSGKLGTGKFWVAKDFPDAKALNELQDKMLKSMGNPTASFVPQNNDFRGMVLKSEMEVMGKKTSSELVSAKQEAVSDDAFKTPEGYQEMKIPGLGR